MDVATRTRTDSSPESEAAPTSPYERGWTVAAVLAATAWIAVGVLESRPLPLLALVTMLGAYGGVLAVRASLLSPVGRRQYAAGAAAAAGVVLVLAGMRQHPAAGLAVLGVLAASSPHLLRWVADGGRGSGRSR